MDDTYGGEVGDRMLREPTEPNFGRQRSLPTQLTASSPQRQFDSNRQSPFSLAQPVLLHKELRGGSPNG